mgnify:CR=1 FL=1
MKFNFFLLLIFGIVGCSDSSSKPVLSLKCIDEITTWDVVINSNTQTITVDNRVHNKNFTKNNISVSADKESKYLKNIYYDSVKYYFKNKSWTRSSTEVPIRKDSIITETQTRSYGGSCKEV